MKPMLQVMNVTGSAQVAAMAANTSLQNGTSITVLANALQNQSQQAAQLLQTLPAAPQAEGKGTLVDVRA